MNQEQADLFTEEVLGHALELARRGNFKDDVNVTVSCTVTTHTSKDMSGDED